MYDLDEATEKEIKSLCDKIIGGREIIEKKFSNMMNDFFDESWNNFIEYLENDSEINLSLCIKRRVDTLMEGLLSGDTKYLKDYKIISEYDFGRLKRIRLAIWESAGGEIADSTIDALTKENEELKKQLKNERRYRNY